MLKLLFWRGGSAFCAHGLITLGLISRETLINSVVRGEVLSLTKGRTMNTEFNKISMLDVTFFDKALLSEAKACRELVERGSGRTELIRVSLEI